LKKLLNVTYLQLSATERQGGYPEHPQLIDDKLHRSLPLPVA